MARTAKSILLATFLWALILTGIAAVVHYLVIPRFRAARQAQATGQNGSRDAAQATVRLAADNFSGYCLLRSPELADRLARRGVAWSVLDDAADYMGRLRALQTGSVEMAVFPVNSLIQCGDRLGSFPAAIVYLIDETVGADALIARKSRVASLADLNTPEARFVLTPDSPSEFLVRIVLASFSLPAVPRDTWLLPARGSADVCRLFRSESRALPHAYALWEPDVSRALADPDAHILVDTSKLKGYVIDALVVRREFIVEHEAVVRTVVEEYARTVYAARDRMAEAVARDISAGGGTASPAEAEAVAKGIRWKNTLENYAHFGITGGTDGLDSLAAIVRKVTEVLVRTEALNRDPLAGATESITFDRVVRALAKSGFHPGRELNLLGDLPQPGTDEPVRGAETAVSLTEAQWQALVTVGEMRVDPILFGRGNAAIGVQGEQALTALAETLASWPHYYLSVTGRVRPGGEQAAALHLARTRAEAVVAILSAKGVAPQRLRTAAEIAPRDVPEAQAVVFVVSQAPY